MRPNTSSGSGSRKARESCKAKTQHPLPSPVTRISGAFMSQPAAGGGREWGAMALEEGARRNAGAARGFSAKGWIRGLYINVLPQYFHKTP
jgi:hypothetical protein